LPEVLALGNLAPERGHLSERRISSNGQAGGRRVLLLYPPFGALAFPSIGLSLLKASLDQAGIPCDVRYLNYDFLDLLPGAAAERMATFDRLSRRSDYSVGDWMFNGELFDQAVVARLDERFRAFLAAQGEDEEMLRSSVAVKGIVPDFLDQAMADVPWERYDIVGLHSIFNQTTACLALAARIKRRHPRIHTLFGGPGAGGDLGRAVVARFRQIDYAVQGEADRTIVPLVRRLRTGEDFSRLPGLIHRRPSAGDEPSEVVANPVDLVTDLDALPVPDYSDFFARYDDSGYEWGVDVFVPIENARGCWWGERHHCTFCGLNADTMAFRHKSPERVMDELRTQYGRFGIERFASVDTILDTSYYRTLLPTLRDGDLNLRLFYEIKANVKREQVKLLADAGLTLLQPGLEHLSTDVLRIMRKGTSYRQNVCLLKWARERDITLFWAILYGFPGETLDHYSEIAERIPSLVHLFPPKALVRVRVDRFSPLFFEPEALGLSRIYPADAYRHVYPFDDDELAGFAYHFQGDYADRDPDLNGQIEDLVGDLVRAWNDRFFHGARLDVIEGSRRALIRDTRADGAPRHYLLEGLARRVYEECDAGRPLSRLVALADEPDRPHEGHPVEGIIALEHDLAIEIMLERAAEHDWPVVRIGGGEAAPIEELLEAMEEPGLMTRDGDWWISLACRTDDPVALLERVSQHGQRELASMAATRDISLPGG
jgi:ribosomal peptide maturation radical SAM protein 1